MKYFANFEADAVVREDDSGVRYIKHLESLQEYEATKTNREAWGIPSYGVFNMLREITQEQYETFGVKWVFNERGDIKLSSD